MRMFLAFLFSIMALGCVNTEEECIGRFEEKYPGKVYSYTKEPVHDFMFFKLEKDSTRVFMCYLSSPQLRLYVINLDIKEE